MRYPIGRHPSRHFSSFQEWRMRGCPGEPAQDPEPLKSCPGCGEPFDGAAPICEPCYEFHMSNPGEDVPAEAQDWYKAAVEAGRYN